MTTRREVLKLMPTLAVAAASPLVASAWDGVGATVPPSQSPPQGPFTLPPLPYAADALEPHIDAETMTIHHGRHHAAYVNNLNQALAGKPDLAGKSIEALVSDLEAVPADIRTSVRNNGGGHFNHTLFWTSLKKDGGSPSSAMAGVLSQAFGSVEKWQDAMTRAAMGVFGSGWAWLCVDRGKLVVSWTPNQDTPLAERHVPLVGIDVWEHAYYLKYQNRRRDYVDAVFRIIDWSVVEARYDEARRRA